MSGADVFRVQLSGRDGVLIDAVVSLLADTPALWRLVLEDCGFGQVCVEGSDVFDALVELRRVLERRDLLLLCAGARVDTYPSGMSREMGAGRLVYITKLGFPATERVDVFDYAPLDLVGSIEEQKAHHARWTAGFQLDGAHAAEIEGQARELWRKRAGEWEQSEEEGGEGRPRWRRPT